MAVNGGVYFDTDVLFVKPVPDELLDCDVLVTIDKSAFGYEVSGMPPDMEQMPGFNNLAMLGCARWEQVLPVRLRLRYGPPRLASRR